MHIIQTMNQKLLKLWDDLTPFKGIIYFLFLLFFLNFCWKFAIDGDVEDNYMLFFGKDITQDWFYTIQLWTTDAVVWFIRLFPNTDTLFVKKTLFGFTDGDNITLSIIWGCTGMKQMFIFTCIMLLYKCFTLKEKPNGSGYTFILLPYWNKLWYIPLGWIILTAYNIVRIGSIGMLTRYHAERFESLHDGIFRWIYYGIIFILWVVWEEAYVRKASKA